MTIIVLHVVCYSLILCNITILCRDPCIITAVFYCLVPTGAPQNITTDIDVEKVDIRFKVGTQHIISTFKTCTVFP